MNTTYHLALSESLQHFQNFSTFNQTVVEDHSEDPLMAGIAAAATCLIAKNFTWLQFLVPGSLAWSTAALIGGGCFFFTFLNVSTHHKIFKRNLLLPSLCAQAIFYWMLPVPAVTAIFFTVVGSCAGVFTRFLVKRINPNENERPNTIQLTLKSAFRASAGGILLKGGILGLQILSIYEGLFNSSVLVGALNSIPSSLTWTNVIVYSSIGTGIFHAGAALEESVHHPFYKGLALTLIVLTYSAYCYFSPLPVIATITLTFLGVVADNSLYR